MQAVRAAAEAQQAPSDAEAGPLLARPIAKPMGPNNLPVAAKPSKAKPVIIRKRAQPAPDVQQVGPQRMVLLVQDMYYGPPDTSSAYCIAACSSIFTDTFSSATAASVSVS